MPPVIGALAAAAITTFSAKVIIGLTALKALAYGAVVGGLSILNSLLARQPNVSISGGGVASSLIRAATVPRRHAIGRVRGSGLLILAEVDADDPKVLHMVIVVSVGACDGIERVWVDGEEVTFTAAAVSDADGGGRKLSCQGARHDMDRNYADRLVLYEFFKGDGTQGKPIRDAVPDVWAETAKLHDCSYVYAKLSQTDYRNDLDDRFWRRPPNLEFLLRGRKLTWPGQAVPTWTRNPAAIRYWHDTERLGRPTSIIDMPSFVSAYSVCDQDIVLQVPQAYQNEGWQTRVKRYACDGWVFEDPNTPQTAIEEEINFAWMGFVAVFGGRLYYRPGVEPALAAVINGDDVILERLGFRPEPPLHERVNVMTGQLRQSSEHDWTAYQLPEIADVDAIARDGQRLSKNMGTRELVADPIVGARNATIELRRNRAALFVQYRISPGADLEYLALKPGDLISWTDTYYGLEQLAFRVLEVTLQPDWSLDISLQRWFPGVYDDTLLLPPLPHLFGRPLELPSPRGVAADELAIVQPDGTVLVVLRITWTVAGVFETQVQWRKKGTPTWARVTTLDARVDLSPVEVGATYQYRVRHKWGGGHWSDYTDTYEERIDGDLDPPADAAGLQAQALPAGYQLTWTPSPAPDYGYTIIEDRIGNAGEFTERGRVTGNKIAILGLLGEQLYNVRIRHADRSHNLGGYSDIERVMTDRFAEDGAPGTRARGDFYRPVARSSWSDAEADAATPGDNVTTDTVTLYNPNSDYIETRAWDGDAWIAFQARWDGTNLFPGTILANALRANFVDLDNAVVRGTLTAGHVDSDVPNSRLLFDGNISLNTNPRNTTVVALLADADVKRWGTLLFNIYGPSGYVLTGARVNEMPTAESTNYELEVGPHINLSGSDIAPAYHVWRNASGNQLTFRFSGQWRSGGAPILKSVVGIKFPGFTYNAATPTAPTSGNVLQTRSIYRLATAPPSVPTGGTTSQNHLPSGWLTTEPDPTATQNVYSVSRTETYNASNVFQSATAWGTLIKTADKTSGGTPDPDPPSSEAPGVPGSVTGERILSDRRGLRLRWAAPALGGPPTLYRVQFEYSDGRAVGEATTVGNLYNHSVQSPVSVTRGRVRAENSHGESGWSAWVTG